MNMTCKVMVFIVQWQCRIITYSAIVAFLLLHCNQTMSRCHCSALYPVLPHSASGHVVCIHNMTCVRTNRHTQTHVPSAVSAQLDSGDAWQWKDIDCCTVVPVFSQSPGGWNTKLVGFHAVAAVFAGSTRWLLQIVCINEHGTIFASALGSKSSHL